MRLDEAIAELPVVAILRGVRPDEILATAQVLHAEGIHAVEVPLNSPEPFESLRRLTAAFAGRLACGAGTVLAVDAVDAVARAGGAMVIAPNTDPAVIRRAVELGLDPAPGFATASEAFTAIAAGARHLKLFPAITYGPAHLRQLGAVLPPDVVTWAVGGVGADAMADWWAAGARAFGVGSELYRVGQTPTETRARAARLVAAVRALAP